MFVYLLDAFPRIVYIIQLCAINYSIQMEIGDDELLDQIESDDSSFLRCIHRESSLAGRHLVSLNHGSSLLKDSPSLPCAAAFLDAEKCISMFHKEGFSFLDTDAKGRDITYYAIMGGSSSMVKALVEMGVDFSKSLHLAVTQSNLSITEFLFEREHKELDELGHNLLHLACNVPTARFLVKSGVDINAHDSFVSWVVMEFPIRKQFTTPYCCNQRDT